MMTGDVSVISPYHASRKFSYSCAGANTGLGRHLTEIHMGWNFHVQCLWIIPSISSEFYRYDVDISEHILTIKYWASSLTSHFSVLITRNLSVINSLFVVVSPVIKVATQIVALVPVFLVRQSGSV